MLYDIDEKLESIINNKKTALSIKYLSNVANEDMKSTEMSLSRLEKNAKIFINKRHQVMSLKLVNLVPAKIISRSDKFLFAKLLDSNRKVYISNNLSKGALVNDVVLLSNLVDNFKGLSARVKKIVNRFKNQITGVVYTKAEKCFVVPDRAYKCHIILRNYKKSELKNGDKVKVFVMYDEQSDSLYAVLSKKYGKATVAAVCADAVIDSYGFKTKFSDEALAIAKEINNRSINQEDIDKRLDLRKMCIMTIDGAEAKDLDDAVSVERVDDMYKLGVHIADVSHYVKMSTQLDAEAFERGTSVYFIDKVIPMLPFGISNGICSLTEGKERLTFSVIMHISKTGELVRYELKKSVIVSNVRGVYSEVNALLAGEATNEVKNKYKDVADMLAVCSELAAVLEEASDRRGIVNLESVESVFTMNKKGVCVNVAPRCRGESEKIIEQFMIMANHAVSLFARENSIPFVYRVHACPELEKVELLRRLVNILGFSSNNLTPGLKIEDLAKLMRSVRGTDRERIVSYYLLRTMSKARYSEIQTGHFGLGLEDYCHFTSPIRRYSDLAVHRILAQFIVNKNLEYVTMKFSHYVAKVAKNSSKCEGMAVNAERDIEVCYMAEYMTRYINQEYVGIISLITSNGVFVELTNSVSGFLGLRSFPGCSFISDGLTKHVDRKNNIVLQIGRKIKVKVSEADVTTGSITFSPVLE